MLVSSERRRRVLRSARKRFQVRVSGTEEGVDMGDVVAGAVEAWRREGKRMEGLWVAGRRVALGWQCWVLGVEGEVE
jgi:hypothetical protein